MRLYLLILSSLLLTFCPQALAQTRLKLSAIIPGTEKVQLVYNGDFQFPGQLSNNSYPSPSGWTRQADMFVGPGTNMVLANNGTVALAYVDGGAAVGMYKRAIALEPNTAYVLSAYLWNLGNAANHVSTVIDLNDAKSEPQVSLSYGDANADQGYFVYRSFTTADTGSNVTLRVFYDGLTGTGAAPGYFPVGAQWDNLAITKASDFIPPQSSGSGANLRPTVAIYSPADGESLFVATVPAVLPITASAADFDGTIAQVEFYADATKVGQATASPYSVLWSNVPSGSFRLTAVATDNRGAATVSAPVSIATTILPQPVSLSIASLGTNVVVFWPTSATASSLQYTANLAARPWKLITNAPVVSGDQNAVTLPNTNGQQVYRLGAEVDPGTLSRKLMMGYQGWFA
ncbi:MAG TPA: Ig-like domain-containing protein, partial [Bacillota bacterium]|nr:Ig-like domain-containing protein [Bacillota bacterium]